MCLTLKEIHNFNKDKTVILYYYNYCCYTYRKVLHHNIKVQTTNNEPCCQGCHRDEDNEGDKIAA